MLCDELENKAVTITQDFFDKDAYIVENSTIKRVSLVKDDKTIVTVEFDTPVFGLWSPVGKGVPFVCIEPWNGRTDRADFDGDLTKESGAINWHRAKNSFRDIRYGLADRKDIINFIIITKAASEVLKTPWVLFF